MAAAAAAGRSGESPGNAGRPGPPRVGARLFVAVDVGDAVRAEAARVIQLLAAKLEAVKTPPKVVWVKPAALHVTLRFLGEVDDALVPEICDKLAPPFAQAPFEVTWRGVGAFPSTRHPRALWLGVVGGGGALGALEAEVARRLAGSLDTEARPLLPHLTLGRVKMAGAGVDWPKVLQAVEVRGARSVIDRVTLYRSQLTTKGPHYTGLVSALLIPTDP